MSSYGPGDTLVEGGIPSWGPRPTSRRSAAVTLPKFPRTLPISNDFFIDALEQALRQPDILKAFKRADIRDSLEMIIAIMAGNATLLLDEPMLREAATASAPTFRRQPSLSQKALMTLFRSACEVQSRALKAQLKRTLLDFFILHADTTRMGTRTSQACWLSLMNSMIEADPEDENFKEIIQSFFDDNTLKMEENHGRTSLVLFKEETQPREGFKKLHYFLANMNAELQANVPHLWPMLFSLSSQESTLDRNLDLLTQDPEFRFLETIAREIQLVDSLSDQEHAQEYKKALIEKTTEELKTANPKLIVAWRRKLTTDQMRVLEHTKDLLPKKVKEIITRADELRAMRQKERAALAEKDRALQEFESKKAVLEKDTTEKKARYEAERSRLTSEIATEHETLERQLEEIRRKESEVITLKQATDTRAEELHVRETELEKSKTKLKDLQASLGEKEVELSRRQTEFERDLQAAQKKLEERSHSIDDREAEIKQQELAIARLRKKLERQEEEFTRDSKAMDEAARDIIQRESKLLSLRDTVQGEHHQAALEKEAIVREKEIAIHEREEADKRLESLRQEAVELAKQKEVANAVALHAPELEHHEIDLQAREKALQEAVAKFEDEKRVTGLELQKLREALEKREAHVTGLEKREKTLEKRERELEEHSTLLAHQLEEKKTLEAKIREEQEQLQQAKKDLKGTEKEHHTAEELAKLEAHLKDQESRLTERERRLEKEIEALRRNQAESTRLLTEAHQEELGRTKADYDARLAALQSSLDGTLHDEEAVLTGLEADGSAEEKKFAAKRKELLQTRLRTAKLKEALPKKRERTASTQRELDALQLEEGQLTGELKDLTDTLARQKAELPIRQETLRQLRQRHAAEAQQLREEIDRITQTLSDLQRETDKETQEYERLNQGLSTELRRLDGELDPAKKRLKEAKEKRAALEKDNPDLAAKKEELARTQREEHQLSQRIAALELTIEARRKEMETLTALISAHRQKIGQLQGKPAELDKRLASLRDEIEPLREEEERLISTIAEKTDSIAEQSSQRDRLILSISALTQEESTLTTQLASVSADLERKKVSELGSRQKTASLKEDLTKAKEQLAALEADIRVQTAQIAELKLRQSEIDAQRKKSEVDFRALAKEIRALEDAIKAAKAASLREIEREHTLAAAALTDLVAKDYELAHESDQRMVATSAALDAIPGEFAEPMTRAFESRLEHPESLDSVQDYADFAVEYLLVTDTIMDKKKCPVALHMTAHHPNFISMGRQIFLDYVLKHGDTPTEFWAHLSPNFQHFYAAVARGADSAAFEFQVNYALHQYHYPEDPQNPPQSMPKISDPKDLPTSWTIDLSIRKQNTVLEELYRNLRTGKRIASSGERGGTETAIMKEKISALKYPMSPSLSLEDLTQYIAWASSICGLGRKGPVLRSLAADALRTCIPADTPAKQTFLIVYQLLLCPHGKEPEGRVEEPKFVPKVTSIVSGMYNAPKIDRLAAAPAEPISFASTMPPAVTFKLSQDPVDVVPLNAQLRLLQSGMPASLDLETIAYYFASHEELPEAMLNRFSVADRLHLLRDRVFPYLVVSLQKRAVETEDHAKLRFLRTPAPWTEVVKLLPPPPSPDDELGLLQRICREMVCPAEKGGLLCGSALTTEQIPWLNIFASVTSESRPRTLYGEAGAGKTLISKEAARVVLGSINVPFVVHVGPTPPLTEGWQELKTLGDLNTVPAGQTTHFYVSYEEYAKMLSTGAAPNPAGCFVFDEFDDDAAGDLPKLTFDRNCKRQVLMSATANLQALEDQLALITFKLSPDGEPLRKEKCDRSTPRITDADECAKLRRKQIEIQERIRRMKEDVEAELSLSAVKFAQKTEPETFTFIATQIAEKCRTPNPSGHKFLVEFPEIPNSGIDTFVTTFREKFGQRVPVVIVFQNSKGEKKAILQNGDEISFIEFEKIYAQASAKPPVVGAYGPGAGVDLGFVSTAADEQFLAYREVPPKHRHYQHLRRLRGDVDERKKTTRWVFYMGSDATVTDMSTFQAQAERLQQERSRQSEMKRIEVKLSILKRKIAQRIASDAFEDQITALARAMVPKKASVSSLPHVKGAATAPPPPPSLTPDQKAVLKMVKEETDAALARAMDSLTSEDLTKDVDVIALKIRDSVSTALITPTSDDETLQLQMIGTLLLYSPSELMNEIWCNDSRKGGRKGTTSEYEKITVLSKLRSFFSSLGSPGDEQIRALWTRLYPDRNVAMLDVPVSYERKTGFAPDLFKKHLTLIPLTMTCEKDTVLADRLQKKRDKLAKKTKQTRALQEQRDALAEKLEEITSLQESADSALSLKRRQYEIMVGNLRTPLRRPRPLTAAAGKP